MSGNSTNSTANHDLGPHGRFYTVRNYRSCYSRKGKNNRPCGRWNCKKRRCRDLWSYRVERRIEMGLTELLNEGHELYFVTLHLKNVSQPTETMQEISATHELLNKALKEMRKFARTEKRELYFMRISGTKSDDATTPHQLHTHAIFSLIPDGEPMPSKSHPHRYQSETFQKIAEKYGLRVWISKVYSPKYLAQYMCRNLRQLNDAALSGHIDLPSGYNRVSFSQNWWKSDYLRNLAKRRAKRHTAVKVTSNDWKQLVPKLPEMSLLGDFLFIRCATSGWKCRQVHLSVVYCITMLSDEFKREIMLYRPLGYSAQKRVVAVFSTSQVMNSVQSRNSRCQNTKVSTVARVRYKYCESKHSEWTTDTYKGRKSLGGAAYHLTRPPPIPVNYQPLRNFEWGKFKSMIC